MSEIVGYARVSSTSQHLDAQMDALHQAGCTKTFTDTDSGAQSSRPGWEALRAYLRPGDVLVITELSRMTRSLMHLLHIVQELAERQVALQSLREHIDTSTATGWGFLAIMGVIAQMEREIKAERAAAGRATAKARGKTGGRPRTDPDKLEQARILYKHSDRSVAQVCQLFGFSRRTLFNYIAEQKVCSA